MIVREVAPLSSAVRDKKIVFIMNLFYVYRPLPGSGVSLTSKHRPTLGLMRLASRPRVLESQSSAYRSCVGNDGVGLKEVGPA